MKRGVAIADRVRWAPLPMQCRARLLASLVLPSSMYGFCVGGLTCHQINSLTSAVMRALWGTRRALRSKDVVLSLFVPGHLVDPRQASVYQCLCMLRRFVQKRPDLKAMFLRCWQAYAHECRSAPGPIGLIAKMVAQLGWSWVEFDKFSRPGRSELPVAGGPDSWWLHEVRDGLRLARWACAAASRHDMEGLDALQGVDRQATLACLNSKLDPYDAGMLRGILSGSIRLRKRLCEAGLADSSVCQFCGMCDETVEHCFWECSRWDHVRMRYDVPPASVTSQWPACTKSCGLFLENPCVLDLKTELENEEAATRDLSQYFDCQAVSIAVQNCSNPNEKQIIWTDGAASFNQDHRFRRAGSGIFYSEAHHMNLSVILPGVVQSNQRAELLAVLLSCLRDPRPLDIRSDSEYVCNGFAVWRSWSKTGWRHDNADLWNQLASHMCSRATCVQVSWVKGHAKPVDVLRGRTTEEDRLGNNGADSLAVAGARMHQVPVEVVASAAERKQYAKHVHEMMVAILKARLAAEGELSSEADAADRGSEADTCMEFLDDDFDGDCIQSDAN